jgi:hypothetical protein
VTPSEVRPKEEVTISTVVTNTGGSDGSYTVVLKINGVAERTKEFTIGAGTSETVSFTIAKDSEGVFGVNINGKTGQFAVIVPVAPTTPAPIAALPVQPSTNSRLVSGIIIGSIIVIGLLVYLFALRRRGAAKQNQISA